MRGETKIVRGKAERVSKREEERKNEWKEKRGKVFVLTTFFLTKKRTVVFKLCNTWLSVQWFPVFQINTKGKKCLTCRYILICNMINTHKNILTNRPDLISSLEMGLNWHLSFKFFFISQRKKKLVFDQSGKKRAFELLFLCYLRKSLCKRKKLKAIEEALKGEDN